MRYKNEFKAKKSKCEMFQLNERVRIRNENKKDKMMMNLKIGKIKKKVGLNTYEIETKDKRKLVRHACQLKSLREGGVVCNASFNRKNSASNDKGVISPY
ncbi:hypothetical protein DMUE_4802 [Dictyocoela muelleri]|nr:hypothetical protein DMUE_4802 [Dictyocoela muelleri]